MATFALFNKRVFGSTLKKKVGCALFFLTFMRMTRARMTAMAQSIEAAYIVAVAVDYIPSSFVLTSPRVFEFIVSSLAAKVPTSVPACPENGLKWLLILPLPFRV